MEVDQGAICPYCSDEKTKYAIKPLKDLGIHMCTNEKCPVSIRVNDSPHSTTFEEKFDKTTCDNSPVIRKFSKSPLKRQSPIKDDKRQSLINISPQKVSPEVNMDKEMEPKNEQLVCTNCSDEKNIHYIEMLDYIGLLICSNKNCSMVIPDGEDPVAFLAGIAREKTMLDNANRNIKLSELRHKQELEMKQQNQSVCQVISSQENNSHLVQTAAEVHVNLVQSAAEVHVNQSKSVNTPLTSNGDQILLTEKDTSDSEHSSYSETSEKSVILDQKKQCINADSDCLSLTTEHSDDVADFSVEDDQTDKFRELMEAKYLTWENDSNLCWLNSSLHLLVHNKTVTLSNIVETCIIKDVVKEYKEATTIVNKKILTNYKLKVARKKLSDVRSRALQYLSPLIKCITGIPDSSFCALINLINESKHVRRMFEVKLSWKFSCSSCLRTKVHGFKKSVITLSNVDSFDPVAPVTLCMCPSCKEPGQERQLSYLSASRCLIYHFENGAGSGLLEPHEFYLGSQKYSMTGIILLKKLTPDLNHFLTWIRDPESNYWLECDDLSTNAAVYVKKTPQINLKEVHVIMYESNDKTDFASTLANSPNRKNIIRQLPKKSGKMNDEQNANLLTESSKNKEMGEFLSQHEDALIDLTESDDKIDYPLDICIKKEFISLNDNDSSNQWCSQVTVTDNMKLNEVNVSRKKDSSSPVKPDLRSKSRDQLRNTLECPNKKRKHSFDKKENYTSNQLELDMFNNYTIDDILDTPVMRNEYGSAFQLEDKKSKVSEDRVPLNVQIKKYAHFTSQQQSGKPSVSKEEASFEGLASIDEIVMRTTAAMTKVIYNLTVE